MSILDKMKGALHAVTGGAAEVALVYEGTFAPGATMKVRVTVTSTGGPFRSTGVFVDLRAKKLSAVGQFTGNVVAADDKTFQLLDNFELGPAESRAFDGEIEVPIDIDPALDWEIRGRAEAYGNDPDSGFRDVVR